MSHQVVKIYFPDYESKVSYLKSKLIVFNLLLKTIKSLTLMLAAFSAYLT